MGLPENRIDISEVEGRPGERNLVTKAYPKPWPNPDYEPQPDVVGVWVEGWFLTPRIETSKTFKRLRLVLTSEDHQAYEEQREARDGVVVSDLLSGKRYRVKAASCGLNCRCDATAREIRE